MPPEEIPHQETKEASVEPLTSATALNEASYAFSMTLRNLVTQYRVVPRYGGTNNATIEVELDDLSQQDRIPKAYRGFPVSVVKNPMAI